MTNKCVTCKYFRYSPNNTKIGICSYNSGRGRYDDTCNDYEHSNHQKKKLEERREKRKNRI